MQRALPLVQLPPQRGGFRGARAVTPLRLCRRLLRLPKPLLRAAQLLPRQGKVPLLGGKLGLQVGNLHSGHSGGAQSA